MRQRDFAGLRRIAPADERRRTRRMMRRAKRPLAPLRRARTRACWRTESPRTSALRRRSWAAAGSAGVPPASICPRRAARPSARDVRPPPPLPVRAARRAGRSHRPYRAGRRAGAAVSSGGGDRRQPAVGRAGQMRAQRGQVGSAVDVARPARAPLRPRWPPADRARACRQIELAHPTLPCAHRQLGAAYCRCSRRSMPSQTRRAWAAARRSATARPQIRDACSDSAGICPLAARMPKAIGKSKRPDSFGQVGGSEIDGDTAHGKVETAVLQRGAHALAAFAYFEIGQADYRKRG